MAQIAKVEAQVSLKSSADKFFRAYCDQKNWPKMCPGIVKHIQPIKGDSMFVGSIAKYTYAPIDNSSPQINTLLTEALDEKNKSATWTIIEGVIIKKMYPVMKLIVQATNSPDGNGSSVKATIEYEKANDDVPEPTIHLASYQAAIKTIDAYLVNGP